LRDSVAEGDPPLIVRVTVFDPAIGAVTPAGDASPVVLISSRPAAGPARGALSVVTAGYVRDVPAVKHTGLFAVAALRRKALRAGHDDVLLVAPDGRVTEGATWSVGCHDGERVVWPQRDCLPGITVALLNQAGVPHGFGDVRREQLPEMVAVFIAGSGVGVRPIGMVDGEPVPQSPRIIAELTRAYESIEPEPLG
jgi:branched-subunit amino acid aminotransferase/4-amino-4-deoxychorismate lyase